MVWKCKRCKVKKNAKFGRLFTLEYLALRKVLHNYVLNKNKEQSKKLFDGMNIPSKWKNWNFAIKHAKTSLSGIRKKRFSRVNVCESLRNVLTNRIADYSVVINAHYLVSKLMENPRYIEDSTYFSKAWGIQLFCLCVKPFCSDCVGYKCEYCKSAHERVQKVRDRGHLEYCDKK